jgi:hypothetical protein
MRMIYRDINVRDLQGETLADLLVNIEADFQVIDDSRVIYSESAFPVAELARELARWISLGEQQLSEFCFSSLSFEDPGSVRITPDPSGWVVRSMFTPEIESYPVSWLELVARISEFVADVKRDVAKLGIDPERVLA